MRISAVILIALMLAACAETDPYKRLDPAPTPEMPDAEVGQAFVDRWPRQFKCVQTVTLDFRVASRTLVGYLVVQRPGRFRLQGMSEQGLKLFDITYDQGKLTRVFAAEEFDAAVLTNVARDIRRVFLSMTDDESMSLVDQADFGLLFGAVRPGDGGVRASIRFPYGDLKMHLVGVPPRVDWYEYRQSGRYLYRVDHYEWSDVGGAYLPAVIVLREPGIQSDGPAYKLTIKITEFTERENPWPDKVFQPEGE
ncbi:MAG: DUF3261 domain-containing protein [Planctomycetes bacterium]|nr:DUF3261 domain-containing protein [Planctomycetota bacterium]